MTVTKKLSLTMYSRCRVICLASLGALSPLTTLTCICPTRPVNGPAKKMTHLTTGCVPGNNNNSYSKWHGYVPPLTYWLLQRRCSNNNELLCVQESENYGDEARGFAPWLLPCRLNPVKPIEDFNYLYYFGLGVCEHKDEQLYIFFEMFMVYFPVSA